MISSRFKQESSDKNKHKYTNPAYRHSWLLQAIVVAPPMLPTNHQVHAGYIHLPNNVWRWRPRRRRRTRTCTNLKRPPSGRGLIKPSERSPTSRVPLMYSFFCSKVLLPCWFKQESSDKKHADVHYQTQYLPAMRSIKNTVQKRTHAQTATLHGEWHVNGVYY